MSASIEALQLNDAARCAEAIVDRVGRDIKLAVPIGIGKPVLLLNALYRLAETDRRIRLDIFSGLTLARPRFRSTLEKRFAEPILQRLFPTYPEPLYVAALRKDALPPNIAINEFFLQAGAWLSNGRVQRDYTSLNYAHVASHLERVGINVFAQLIAPSPIPGDDRISLSSNTDITLDMLPYVAARRKAGLPVVVAGELNANLPFMTGDAIGQRSEYDVLLEPDGTPYDLFAPPKEPVSLTDYAMALHAATMIKDGGTLQIGIGSFSDALTHALVLRHTNNGAFRNLIEKLGEPLHPDSELRPFTEGLYGCTEMLVDGYLALMRAGVLKRRVPTPDGGTALLHAGFFVGNRAFYKDLHELPSETMNEIHMSAISYTNTLNGESERKRTERAHARFINTAMTATLLGAISSDALADGRVVSGSGGQLDFVSMAHELKDARSILAVRSTRRQGRETTSNIVWNYANTTIPRSLRDIVVTEYGIADLRGKSDRDTVVAMLSVADAAFQSKLCDQAQKVGKLEPNFALPSHATDNRPDRISTALASARRDGLLPEFPLGSDMTDVEHSLLGPLNALKGASYSDFLRMIVAGLSRAPVNADETAALERLGLSAPQSLADHGWRILVSGAFRRQT